MDETNYVQHLALMVIKILVTVILVAMFYFPITILTDARCLEAGFPEARVTWSFERYCVSYDGTVVRMDSNGNVENSP